MTEPTTLVATWGNGLFAVTEGHQRQEIKDQPVRGLARDGLHGALAIVGGHSLCRRGPSGEWETVATSDFELSCCFRAANAIYVGTDDARLLRLSHEDGVLTPIESFDHIAGRDTWFAGSAVINGQRVGPPLGIRSLAANANGSVLFANVHVGGIPRSMDGGRTWQPTIDINADVHEVSAHASDPDIVAAASALGVCISHDAGATWSIERDGLHAAHCSAVAFAGDDILVSAASDPFAAQGRIYRRTGGRCALMVPVENGLPAWINGIADTGCIAAKGSTAVVVDRAGTVYLSSDCGRTWSQMDNSLPTPSCVLIC